MTRAIGGFLPLRHPHRDARSLTTWSRWTAAATTPWLFHNARSALNALWSTYHPKTAWLPAYVCTDVVSAVPDGIAVRFFDVDDDLEPNVDALSSMVQAGDHVLAVDYFGRPPSVAFRALVSARRDVRWVEDRAQALDPGPAWGDWLLYSARKLVGVPDGGILVAGVGTEPLPQVRSEPLDDFAFMLPSLQRLEDVEENRNETWYASYARVEAHMSPGRTTMSQLSINILKSCDIEADCDRRRSNYRHLHARLERWRFLKEADPTYAPFGFPIVVEDAARLAERLAKRRIFAARHWKTLPCSETEHVNAHELSRKLITLPCDYRYASAEMDLVADAVIDALSA